LQTGVARDATGRGPNRPADGARLWRTALDESELMSEAGPAHAVRVVIADDHPSYRAALARVLRKSGVDVVGEASDGEAALLTAEQSAPDVVLMDVHMPGLSGIEATRRLIQRAPASRVLMLSVSAQDADVTDALLAGASGYLTKEAPIDELINAIRAAAADRAVLSQLAARVLLRRVRNAIWADEFSPSTRLSGRELEVLGHRAAGKADDEIAKALSISLAAVRKHAADILTKLHLEGGAPPPSSGAGSPGE
jgi:DNA-binding NarL/FixJ family response regulator